MDEQTKNHDHLVTVTHNGGDREFPFRPNELAEVLLQEAKTAFGVANQHLLSLFTEGGVELDDKKSLEDQGIHGGELLVLRQSVVKGG